MNSAGSRVSQWKEVTPRAPCAVCGHGSWCSVNWDGSVRICRRMDDGTGKRKVDQSGAEYWVYRPAGLFPVHGAPSMSPSSPPKPEPEPERATAPVLHRAYRELLLRLDLDDRHLENLRTRGLPDKEIAARRYRSYPACGRAFLAGEIVREIGPEACARIPGFYRERVRGLESWQLTGPPGLLVPVRDVSGLIVALKIRTDNPDPDGPKYIYLSSTKKGGPGPGAPVHVPLGVGPAAVVRLTEGELKADIATVLSDIGTISVPGVSVWRSALPALRWTGAKRVRLAFDADARTNPFVARALIQAARALESEHFQLEVETWNLSTKA